MMSLIIYMFATIILLLWYLMDPFYWKKKRIQYLFPWPIIGNVLPIIRYGVIGYYGKLYKTFPGYKYFGIHFLTRPTLFIKDSKMIQQILVKDFEYFTSHGFYTNQDRDPGGASVFHVYGQQWKNIRGKLSQYFTPVKIKAMLSYVDNTMPKIIEIIDKNIDAGIPTEFDLLLKNANTDITTQAIFGVKSDAFDNKNSIFLDILVENLKPSFTMKLFTSVVSSKLYDLLGLTFFHKKVNEVITDIVKKTIQYRKENNVYVQDFLQGMIEMLEENTEMKEQKYFPDNTRIPKNDMPTVISQAITLFVGGVETSAGAMAFFLYQMALHPDIQQKCRDEINANVTNNSPVNVMDLTKLVYTNAAIQETLRIHSPFTMMNRECTKSYKIPDTDIIIDKGTFILMSPIIVHMDENNFSEPNIFRPERFLDEGKNEIKPGTYFPFGLGPRTCIGMNFALGSMKLVLTRLLQKYEFCISSKTQVPVNYGKYLFLTTPAEGMYLDVKPL